MSVSCDIANTDNPNQASDLQLRPRTGDSIPSERGRQAGTTRRDGHKMTGRARMTSLPQVTICIPNEGSRQSENRRRTTSLGTLLPVWDTRLVAAPGGHDRSQDLVTSKISMLKVGFRHRNASFNVLKVGMVGNCRNSACKW